jgi:GTP cyclohydrolase I
MVDRDAAARAIEAFLRALGQPIEGDLVGTGERVADAWADDLLEGEAIDASAILREGSFVIAGETGLVVLRDLAVTTMCPHHLLPAHGVGLVIYQPGERVAGFGTIAHVLDALSRRLTLQERIADGVAELLMSELGARGALCKLALTHTCLIARGERKHRAVVETLATRGSFAVPSPDRDWALATLSATPLHGPS